jgi:hypothetical protein
MPSSKTISDSVDPPSIWNGKSGLRADNRVGVPNDCWGIVRASGLSDNVAYWPKADILIAWGERPLSGVKRTSEFYGVMSACDPNRT